MKKTSNVSANNIYAIAKAISLLNIGGALKEEIGKAVEEHRISKNAVRL